MFSEFENMRIGRPI